MFIIKLISGVYNMLEFQEIPLALILVCPYVWYLIF